MNNLLQILILSTFFLFIKNSNAQSNGFEIIRSLELMDQIYEHLEKFYVDDIQAGKMSKTAIDAMLKELDPYTVYYHEANIEDYRLMTTGQYGGIGSRIRKIDGYVYISELYKDKPAHKSGLKAGDKILTIDGKSMYDLNSEEVSKALKGPKGTKLEIEIERINGEKKKITVERDEIKLPDVPYFGMIDENTGYIKLNSFTRTASSNVKDAFIKLKEQGMENLVLDLRGNGGGLLIEAVKIVNLFIPKGQTVVTTKGRVTEENRTYTTQSDPLDLEIPLIVLVNSSSASASEIVSGSLQDLDRAVVVGTRSYGKGLVQRTYDLDYGAKMKLTIAKYYTPSGRCVQRLEYYNKLKENAPEEIPDSLITIFKTKNGREVIDGRGIEPDIKVEQKELSGLTIALFKNNLIFNYATKFYYSHDSILDPKNFSLSDKEYQNFMTFVLAQEFTYTTSSEEDLIKMKETAEKEGYFEDIKEEYDKMLLKVTPSKERDLKKFKAQIISFLENEIVSRYYFQNGRAIQSFKNDPFIDSSLEILENTSKYNTILGN